MCQCQSFIAAHGRATGSRWNGRAHCRDCQAGSAVYGEIKISRYQNMVSSTANLFHLVSELHDFSLGWEAIALQ